MDIESNTYYDYKSNPGDIRQHDPDYHKKYLVVYILFGFVFLILYCIL